MNIDKLSEMLANTSIKKTSVSRTLPPVIKGESSKVLFGGETSEFTYSDLSSSLDLNQYGYHGKEPGSLGTFYNDWRDRYLRYLNIKSVNIQVLEGEDIIGKFEWEVYPQQIALLDRPLAHWMFTRPATGGGYDIAGFTQSNELTDTPATPSDVIFKIRVEGPVKITVSYEAGEKQL
jgi:hypothetical protein